MTETLTPQAGDVWEGADGTLRFIGRQKSDITWWCDAVAFGGRIDGDDDLDWFATARRVFPPVTASPPGETITVQCAAVRYGESVTVFGQTGMTAEAAGLLCSGGHVYTVPVVLPKREVPVLPAVEVTTPSPTPLVHETDYLD